MERPLWERQPWDTPTSFDRFQRYYLSQSPPRSLDEAYRRYRAEGPGLQTGDNPVAPRRAPGSWQRWARGQDGKGRPIPGAATWEARAVAWDDHQAELERQRWETRRREVREADYQAGQELRELVEKVLEQTPQFIKTTRRLVKGQGRQPDREVITLGINLEAAVKALKLASDLQRQAAELAPPTQEHRVTGSLVSVVADDLAAARDMARRLEQELLEDDDESDDSDGDAGDDEPGA